MWSCSGDYEKSIRLYQIIQCSIKVKELKDKDIFYRVKQQSSPINATPYRFAAMCVAYSKGNHQ